MHRLRLLIPPLLAACTAAGPDSFRAPGVTIASTSRFDAARFTGHWSIIADFAPRADCPPALRFDPGPNPGTLSYHDCPGSGDPSGDSAAGGAVYTVGPYGRLTAEGPPIWVLWIAEDYGTAVIGTPSGQFGRILNRGRQIRPDRLAAAREVLAFNGYDMAQLHEVRR